MLKSSISILQINLFFYKHAINTQPLFKIQNKNKKVLKEHAITYSQSFKCWLNSKK